MRIGNDHLSFVPCLLPLIQNQMANWNKMIAYLNFFLLIFLMVLILIVVISMNYYQLASYYHNRSPEEQGPSTTFSPIA